MLLVLQIRAYFRSDINQQEICYTSISISQTLSQNILKFTFRSGYVPGEHIGFNAEIENLSNREMTSSFLNLVEIIKYKSR